MACVGGGEGEPRTLRDLQWGHRLSNRRPAKSALFQDLESFWSRNRGFGGRTGARGVRTSPKIHDFGSKSFKIYKFAGRLLDNL